MKQISLLAGFLVVLLPVNVGAQPANPAPGEFVEQVRLHFQKWDTDGNGVLSTNEIERAVADPKVKGKEAAAVAALRRAIRANRELKSLSLQQIVASVPYQANATPKLPHFEVMYAAHLERIQSARRELFVSDRPKAEYLSQGKLGDCFLLASLGTVADNDPGRLKKMFKALPRGKVEVTLGSGRKLILDMPTDGEICLALAIRTTACGLLSMRRPSAPSTWNARKPGVMSPR